MIPFCMILNSYIVASIRKKANFSKRTRILCASQAILVYFRKSLGAVEIGYKIKDNILPEKLHIFAKKVTIESFLSLRRQSEDAGSFRGHGWRRKGSVKIHSRKRQKEGKNADISCELREFFPEVSVD